MDKSTLSNYGWVVIVTLVLAVMLALATPFGSYVGKGASNVIKMFAQSSDNAIDEDNVDTEGDNWNRYLIDNEVNHALGVHKGGTYITIDGETTTLSSDTDNKYVEFPVKEPQVGDIYRYGDYEYKYGYECGGTSHWNTDPTPDLNGWGVRRLDLTKKHYEPVLETINLKPLKSMTMLFRNTGTPATVIETLSDNFTIPDTVINIGQIFHGCDKLQKLPASFVIPNSVQYMRSAFFDCRLLTEIPNFQIPKGVKDLSHLFQNCYALQLKDIVIPDSVEILNATFKNTYVAGDIRIGENVKDITEAFTGSGFDPTITIRFLGNPTQYNGCFRVITTSVKISGTKNNTALLNALAVNSYTNDDGTVTEFPENKVIIV